MKHINCLKLLLVIFLLLLCDKSHAIDAYWFNLPTIEIKMGNLQISASSKLYIDGDINDGHKIEIKGLGIDDENIYNDTLDIYKFSKSETIKFLENGKFRAELSVPYLKELPQKIILIRQKITDTVKCYYQELNVKISSSFLQEKTFLAFYPDDFSCNILGYEIPPNKEISIMLPQRIYYCLFAASPNWSSSSLESWFWQLNLKSKRSLTFNISNGEVYNLSAWKNKGGGKSLFIFFRPMAINYPSPISMMINNSKFQCYGNNINLTQDSIEVLIDDKKAEVYSLQYIYETGGINNTALKAYILQVALPKQEEYFHVKVSFLTRINNELVRGEGQLDFIDNLIKKQ